MYKYERCILIANYLKVKTETEQNKVLKHTEISNKQIINKMKVLFFALCVTSSHVSSTYIPPYYEGSPTSIRYVKSEYDFLYDFECIYFASDWLEWTLLTTEERRVSE